MTKPSPERDPKKERATHLRPLTVVTDLDAPIDIEAIAKAADLTPKERDAFETRVKDAIQHFKDNAKGAAFHANPVAVLGERFEHLGQLPPNFIPSTLDSACAGTQAAVASLSGCASTLIIRIAQWSAMSPANRAVLESDPDAAVDAVSSWGFPAEAITLVKSAFQRSRHTP